LYLSRQEEEEEWLAVLQFLGNYPVYYISVATALVLRYIFVNDTDL
jgi:hypothetical protein